MAKNTRYFLLKDLEHNNNLFIFNEGDEFHEFIVSSEDGHIEDNYPARIHLGDQNIQNSENAELSKYFANSLTAKLNPGYDIVEVSKEGFIEQLKQDHQNIMTYRENLPLLKSAPLDAQHLWGLISKTYFPKNVSSLEQGLKSINPKELPTGLFALIQPGPEDVEAFVSTNIPINKTVVSGLLDVYPTLLEFRVQEKYKHCFNKDGLGVFGILSIPRDISQKVMDTDIYMTLPYFSIQIK